MATTTQQPTPLLNKALLAFLLLLICVWLALVVKLFMQGAERSAQAYTDGRFIKIDIKDGKVDGNITTTKEKQSRKDRIAKHLGKIKTPPKSASLPDVPDTSLANKQIPAAALPTIQAVDRPIIAPLAHAPIPELEETLAGGQVLPRISDDGELEPWHYYSKPYAYPQGTQLLSIVITDLGLSAAATQEALGLNEYVTLSFSPYATLLKEQMDAARNSGFETWMMLPMQHEAYPVHDYGPLTLIDEESKAENINQLHRVMEASYGYTGFIATANERFSRSKQMLPIFKEMSRRGLALMLYQESFAPKDNSHLLSYAHRHLDGGNVPDNIQTFFDQTEAYIKTNGRATITIAPLPHVLKKLDSWLGTLQEKNIQLVPLSAQSKEQIQR